ncbi:MAG: glycosyltransferase family 4 protein [Proteobacteria bacterium]|nr:glycosyltransferase family 4 protein [Pseudomonadota bacterium]
MTAAKLRVMHVIPTGGSGGIETTVLNLLRHIDSARFESVVCVVKARGTVSQALQDAGVRTFALRVKTRIGPVAAARLFYELIRFRPHILHVHVGTWLIRFLGWVAGRQIIVTHFHSPHDAWMESHPRLNRGMRMQIRNKFVAFSTRFLACSNDARKMLCEACPELDGRVSVILPCVDPRAFVAKNAGDAEFLDRRRSLGLPADVHVVGFVGRLVAQKGLSNLIAAIQPLVAGGLNVHLLVAGDGPLRSSLEKEAQAAAPGRIHFLGDRADIANLMSLFDLLVVPSLWEPFGMVSLEAMAAGRAVVAFDVGGISEAVISGETGLLITQGNSSELAKGIAYLLEHPEYRRRLGQAGRRRVETEFDIRRYAFRIVELYASWTAARKRRTGLPSGAGFLD